MEWLNAKLPEWGLVHILKSALNSDFIMCITLQSALSLVRFMYINLSSALNSDLVQYRRALALRVFFLKKT